MLVALIVPTEGRYICQILKLKNKGRVWRCRKEVNEGFFFIIDLFVLFYTNKIQKRVSFFLTLG